MKSDNVLARTLDNSVYYNTHIYYLIYFSRVLTRLDLAIALHPSLLIISVLNSSSS